MFSDDLPLKYIPPNWEASTPTKNDSNDRLLEPMGLDKKDSNNLTKDTVERLSPLPITLITGKSPQPDPPAHSELVTAHLFDDVDYERLRFNERESITKLIDGSDYEDNPTIPLPLTTLCHDGPYSTSNNPIYFDLPSKIKNLLEISEDMEQPVLRFDISPAAAAHNWKVFEEYEFDVRRILCNSNSITNFGSEFKTIEQLETLLIRHPRWIDLKQRLTYGVSFPVTPIDNEARKGDVEAAYLRGNHKSAIKKNEFLENAIMKEIKKGWNIILPVGTYNKLPGLVLSPMGVASHTGVTQDGTFETKDRVTHDLSFPGEVSRESVNSRVLESALEPCMFSYVLSRLVHYIVSLRSKYPTSRIWLRKEDYKSAFRRLHLDARTAMESAVVVEIKKINYLVISLRMPFGGAPCPSEFALLTDIITDTINDLLNDDNWDNNTIFSKTFYDIPEPITLSDSIKFAQARSMSVQVPLDVCGKADVFIDDVISCCVDINNNLDRLYKAPCTVIDAVAREGKSSGVQRDPMIEKSKLIAEGAAEETKIILGWLIDTRRLKISLPKHKFIAWTNQIESILNSKTVSNKTLLSILGRLENVAQILIILGHFLSNIRHLQIIAEHRGHNIRLNERTKLDLKLAQKFLQTAHNGVSMNLLTFREPTNIHICDASEYGLGGYASHGRAWRWIIPKSLQGRAHINILEYLAQVVSIWLDVIESTASNEDCILCMGDNTSAMGWLRRSNFRQKDESDKSWLIKQQIGRHLAHIVLNANIVLYHQWIKGSHNQVADSLSRDAYFLSNNSHKKFLLATVPHQLPKNFNIKQLPKEITCFLSSILHKLPENKQWYKQQKPSELAAGNIGILTSIASELTTCSLTHLEKICNIPSCQVLGKLLLKLLRVVVFYIQQIQVRSVDE